MLSRRSFLQLAGASVVATGMRSVERLLPWDGETTNQGRAFAATPIHRVPDKSGAVVAHLWPDSITTIVDYQGEWYRVPAGWVEKSTLQPMQPYDAKAYQFMQSSPFWAEVAAPVAPVRAFCAADAPLVTRIGHGGVANVIDSLPDEPNGWYCIADAKGDLLGWTQGVFWRPVTVELESTAGRCLQIDRAVGLLMALEGSQSVLRTPFSSGDALLSGTYSIRRGAMGGQRWIGQTMYDGVPWTMTFGDHYRLAGVYWHNDFGKPVTDGPAVQISPLMARWLYGWLGDDAHIVVE